MDTFLKSLYQEDLTKQASTDQKQLYARLSVSELEGLAGIPKVAVAGSVDAGADGFKCPNCGVAAGETSSACSTCQAAAEAKVVDKAAPKKTTSPEMPGKTAAAEFLCTAMRAVEGAPENIRHEAIKLAAARLRSI